MKSWDFVNSFSTKIKGYLLYVPSQSTGTECAFLETTVLLMSVPAPLVSYLVLFSFSL